MDEITLFEELKPPPPPDAARIREAAWTRLSAATNAPLVHPARRRSTVMAIGATAALVAAGTGYGLAAARSGSGAPPTGSSSNPAKTGVAGLTAVSGCPGKYITAGTLNQVSGTQLILQPINDQDHQNRAWRSKQVTVDTSASTAITRPASGTLSDITDGSQVVVQGTWSGDRLVATDVGIEAPLPSPGSFGPRFPSFGHHLPAPFASLTHRDLHKIPLQKPVVHFPFAAGTVTDARDGSFTVIMANPLGTHRIRVITSASTKVVTKVSSSLSKLDLGSNVVAVGRIGAHGVLIASTVAERSLVGIGLAGGPFKIRPSGCSATAITTAAVLAGA